MAIIPDRKVNIERTANVYLSAQASNLIKETKGAGAGASLATS